MEPSTPPDDTFLPVVDIEIDEVHPGRSGFVLLGQGADRSEYRLEMHLEMPVDKRTQTVLGEMLAQSEWRLLRRSPTPISRARRPRNRNPAAS